MFYLASVNKVLRHCHSRLARQWFIKDRRTKLVVYENLVLILYASSEGSGKPAPMHTLARYLSDRMHV